MLMHWIVLDATSPTPSIPTLRVCWPSASLTGQIAVADTGTTYNTVAALISHGADGHGAWLPLAGSTGTAGRLDAGSTDTDV